jgi:hypothetical protein
VGGIKFPILQNKDWLIDQYVNKHSSIKDISEQVGCSRSPIYHALNKFMLFSKKVTKYWQLKDRDWLKKRYIEENKTATDIANELNIYQGYGIFLVKESLLRFKLKKHSKRFLKIAHRKQDYFIVRKSVIDGSLLGDGTLWVPNSILESAPMFRRGNKQAQYVKWVAGLMFKKNKLSRIRKVCNKLNDKIFYSYRVSTLTHDSLKKFYHRWYPKDNDNIKVIPSDCSISPLSLLIWFLDDGMTSFIRKRYVVLSICTDGFCKRDQDNLAGRLFNRYGLIFHVRKYRKKYHRMYLHRSQIEKFYHIIGKSPVSSLAYKWKYPIRKVKHKFFELSKWK